MQPQTSIVQTLIRELDEAVEGCDCSETTCGAVKRVLERHCVPGADFLGEAMVRTAPDGYARRLLHNDPDRGYSVTIMVWGAGQGTPVHDHAGMWCVECVYQGRIQVDSYDCTAEDGELVDLEHEETIHAGCGESGHLIPPYDYHSIRNPHERTAVTIHVYGGLMDWCHAFEDQGGGRYRRLRKELAFSS